MKKFQKKIENFKCGNCGHQVRGDGYTNHCPKCLWSRHVDLYPGDRGEECGGMMEPLALIKEGKKISITHRCKKCGEEKKNREGAGDDIEGFLKNLNR